MKSLHKAIGFFMIACIGISLLNHFNLQAIENENILSNEDGLVIGSVIYDSDEYGNISERIVDSEGAITLQQAQQEYYEQFIGGGEAVVSDMSYQLVSIDENGHEVEIGAYADLDEALKHYDEAVAAHPSVNYAVKSQNTYWKIKYGVVRFKKIITNGMISNLNYEEDETKIKGYTNPGYALDAAYLETSSDRTKVKFKMAGVTAWIDASVVDVLPYADKTTYLTYYRLQNGMLQHRLRSSSLSSDGGYASTLNCGYAPDYLKEHTTYYSYDGHYFYTDYFEMIDDYRNNSSVHAVNANQPYYNYYQFLPMHSKTNYTAEELDSYVASHYSEKPTSQNYSDLKSNQSLLVHEGASFMLGHDFGVNPMMTMGIAINESGWGRSRIAITKNNLFGLNAVDSDPSKADIYDSVASCIEIFTKQWVTWGYLDTRDSRYYGGHLGDKASGMNVKYASDPYWGEKAASHAYAIDNALGKKDFEKYSIGIKETADSLNIRKTPSTQSNVIYQLKNPSYNVHQMPVIILENATGSAVNGNTLWYKVYTDHPLDVHQDRIGRYNGEPLSWIYEQKYDFDTSYGYLSSVYIRKLNNAKEENPDAFDVNVFLGKASLHSEDGYLFGISAQTKIDSYIERLNALDENVSVEIDTNGHENSNQYLATDMILKLKSSSGEEVKFTIVIKGDVNGDGKISSLDYVLIKNHILKISMLTDTSAVAANVNREEDNKISSLDYVLVKNHILGISEIK